MEHLINRRTAAVFGAAVIGAGGVAAIEAPPAHPHTVSVACVNQRIVATGDLFPASPLVTQAALTVDGVARPPQIVDPGIPGPRPAYTFPELLYGEHVIVVSLVNGGTWTSPATVVTCGPPPSSETSQETPTGGSVVVPVPPTCAELRVLYPKAGPLFWARVGCPAPRKPPVVKPPAPKAKITCIDLKRRGAGRDWYVRLKIPYYACNPVKAPKRPIVPPVMG